MNVSASLPPYFNCHAHTTVMKLTVFDCIAFVGGLSRDRKAVVVVVDGDVKIVSRSFSVAEKVAKKALVMHSRGF